MNDRLACGLDDPRIRFEPELIDADEDEDPLSEMEVRLGWLFDEWAEAQADDTLDAWRDVRMVIHGAIQALNYCHADPRHEDRMALMTLGSVAHENGLVCIQEGKYEGAAA